MSRALWFVAGAASGVYTLAKVKRTVDNFTPDGLAARAAAIRAGARAFADEVNAGRAEREADLLVELRASAAPYRTIERPAATTGPTTSRAGGADGHR